MKIGLDAKTQAFYKGVNAAGETQHKVAELMPTDATGDGRQAMFWTLIGRKSTEFTTQEEVDAFILGANNVAPTRSGFWLEFDTTGPQFHRHDAEAEDYDYEADARDMGTALSRVLVGVASDVMDGIDKNDIRDDRGRKIGRWVLNDE